MFGNALHRFVRHQIERNSRSYTTRPYALNLSEMLSYETYQSGAAEHMHKPTSVSHPVRASSSTGTRSCHLQHTGSFPYQFLLVSKSAEAPVDVREDGAGVNAGATSTTLTSQIEAH